MLSEVFILCISQVEFIFSLGGAVGCNGATEGPPRGLPGHRGRHGVRRDVYIYGGFSFVSL